MTRLDRMLAQYPPFLRKDPDIVAVNSVAALELDRIEAAMDELIANFTPQNADLFLHFWEYLFKLPTNPPSKTLEQRRVTVVTFLRRLAQGGAGLNWVARLIDLIGSNWTYIVHTPDGIKGLLWDRMRTVDAGWEFQIEPASIVVLQDPSGWRFSNNGNGRCIRTDLDPVADADFCIQFSKDEALSTALLAAIPKQLDTNNRLRVSWQNGTLELVSVIGGAASSLGSVAAALEDDKLYWLRGWVDGNTFKGEIWDSDPTKNNSDTPLYSKSVTLTGEKATKLGEGIEGHQGFSWVNLSNPSWLIRQVRVNEVGFNVPANTLRVTVPFDGDNFRVLEIGILLRAITPANTAIEVFLDAGFILGVSRLGVQGF